MEGEGRPEPEGGRPVGRAVMEGEDRQCPESRVGGDRERPLWGEAGAQREGRRRQTRGRLGTRGEAQWLPGRVKPEPSRPALRGGRQIEEGAD